MLPAAVWGRQLLSRFLTVCRHRSCLASPWGFNLRARVCCAFCMLQVLLCHPTVCFASWGGLEGLRPFPFQLPTTGKDLLQSPCPATLPCFLSLKSHFFPFFFFFGPSWRERPAGTSGASTGAYKWEVWHRLGRLTGDSSVGRSWGQLGCTGTPPGTPKTRLGGAGLEQPNWQETLFRVGSEQPPQGLLDHVFPGCLL